MAKKGSERRKPERKSCYIKGKISDGEKIHEIIIVDISLHGYRFKTVDDSVILSKNKVLTIEYILPNVTVKPEIIDNIKIKHRATDNSYCGAVVVNPIAYSFNIKNKGFWLMDTPYNDLVMD